MVPHTNPRRIAMVLAAATVAGLSLFLDASAAAAGSLGSSSSGVRGHWIGTWEAAPSGVSTLTCADCTIRNILHTTIGGRQVRVRISNTFGTAPLDLGHATVALPDAAGSATVEPGSLRVLRFDGRTAVEIPAGGSVVSDPVQLTVPAHQDLLVTTYTPNQPSAFTYHPDAQQYSFYVPGADRATDPDGGDFTQRTSSWYLVTGVSVSGGTAPGAVVAFGDSITDGYQSTYNVDHRWPDVLANRLGGLPAGRDRSVLNAGIGGNRILLDGGNGFGPPALARFDRDVLDQPSLRTVIILLGINDIQQTPHQYDATKIIAGLQQLADRAHAAGVRVIGGTVTPYEGFPAYETAGEQAREAVNQWIRTTKAFDAVVDFDAVVRDPADPLRMAPAYDCGDHLHPNDAGYQAMGDAIDLRQL
jgi:lysophospholipase L1-like esterase